MYWHPNKPALNYIWGSFAWTVTDSTAKEKKEKESKNEAQDQNLLEDNYVINFKHVMKRASMYKSPQPALRRPNRDRVLLT